MLMVVLEEMLLVESVQMEQEAAAEVAAMVLVMELQEVLEL